MSQASQVSQESNSTHSEPQALPHSDQEEALWQELGQRPQPKAPEQLQANILRAVRQHELEKKNQAPLFAWFCQHPALASGLGLLMITALMASLLLPNFSPETLRNSSASTAAGTESQPSTEILLSEEEWFWLTGEIEENQSPQSQQLPKNSTEAQLLAWEPYLAVDPLITYAASSDEWPSSDFLAYEELF